MEKRVKVIYDDGCPTCTVGMKVARTIGDDSMEFVGMNTDEGKRLIHEHNLDVEKSACSLQDGVVAKKAAMMRRVLNHGGIIGFLLSLPFRIPYLSDKLYDLLALHRKHVMKSHLE